MFKNKKEGFNQIDKAAFKNYFVFSISVLTNIIMMELLKHEIIVK